mmetsp:Transcript_7322/g.8037  ORF Transcript_7322/g.8037 Transcript_7322/m.8037 type:complete len:265 (-) Transcript_7322:28-822(-)
MFAEGSELSMWANRLTGKNKNSDSVGDKETAVAKIAFYFDRIENKATRFNNFAIRLQDMFYIEKLGPEDFQSGKLTNESYDAVIFPGGIIWDVTEKLTPKGIKAVRNFIKNGGGFLGTCCGAWLASEPYGHFLGATTVDSEHWDRGIGDIKVRMTPKGKEILGDWYSDFKVFFRGGVLYEPVKSEKVPAADVLFTYEEEIGTKKYGLMVGTGAGACGTLGKGRVLGIGPHPENSSMELAPLLKNAMLWVVKKEELKLTKPIQAL